MQAGPHPASDQADSTAGINKNRPRIPEKQKKNIWKK